MSEQTPLQHALTAAAEFARRHGVDSDLDADSFGIQRSAPGMTSALFADHGHLVVALVSGSRTTFGLARLEWVHFPDTVNGPESCGEGCTLTEEDSDVRP